MGKINGIRIQTEFEKEVKRRRKENYDLLVAQSTYEKNMSDLKTTKWFLILTLLSIVIETLTN